jgi:hypothetical protein
MRAGWQQNGRKSELNAFLEAGRWDWIHTEIRSAEAQKMGSQGRMNQGDRMADNDELKRTIAQLMSRNSQIATLIERLRSKHATDDTQAKDAALQEEFDANQAIISRLTQTQS